MSGYDQLAEFIEQQDGISREEAEHAIRRCALAMSLTGFAGWEAGAGAVAYFLNPGVMMVGGVVGAGAGAYQAYKRAPQCSEVRDAIRYWNTATF
jgi:hypothetical protein